MQWYAWVFSGIGVAVILLCIEWWRRRSRSSGQGITAPGSKVEGSPQALGSGIIQNYGNISFEHQPDHRPKQPVHETPVPNLKIVGVRTVFVRGMEQALHDGIQRALYESREEERYVAYVLDVTNDTSKGVPNSKALVKATLVYKDMEGNEKLRVTAAWLGIVGGEFWFDFDSPNIIIAGVAHEDQFYVPSTRVVTVGYRHDEDWLLDPNPFSVPQTVLTVRLTDVYTGFVYCEQHFDLELGRLPRLTLRPSL